MSGYEINLIFNSTNYVLHRLMNKNVNIVVSKYVRNLSWIEATGIIGIAINKDDVEATQYQKELLLKELLK